MNIIIGTRGSDLSLKQTQIVEHKLRRLYPETSIETVTITTKGDKNMKPIPLDSVGKGWFTKEIDAKLLYGEIDLAVHSLKDVPETLPDELLLAAIPQREDAREVLVSKQGLLFESLPLHAVIGTDSTRRKAQLLHKRPDLIVKSIRGNVNTRLNKLQEQEYDGLILAAAGLIRLGFQRYITQYFPLTDFIPSPGQGALAVVIHEKNKALQKMLEKITDEKTLHAVNAERAFSAAVGGGCKTPVGAFAQCRGKTLTLYGMIGTPDGKEIGIVHGKDAVTNDVVLGIKLAESVLEKCRFWYSV